MSLRPGTFIGPYEILSPLGEGGMGEVFRARDTRLQRDVAVKVLRAAVAQNPDRLARFGREAQLLAALNHPNIAHIHGLEEANGVIALVLELVDGEDLAFRLLRGPVPLDEALSIARQIADALATAHDNGIIHRDLKPSNVKVRPDGTVKMLDFGLAKAADSSGGLSVSDMSAPTLVGPSTQPGIVLGTAAYMPPEQARGKVVDKRADIWALGCVLFEMISGVRAFPGDDPASSMIAVITREPDWDVLPPDLPAAVLRLLRRCLEKDPKRRLDSASAVRIEIEEVLADSSLRSRIVTWPGSPARRGWSRRLRRLWPWAFAMGAVGVVLAAVLLRVWSAAPDAERQGALRFQIPAPPGVAFDFLDDNSGAPAISPDGRQLVFVASNADGTSRLFLRALDSLTIRDLPNTVGAQHPFWSFDSRSIGFYADGKLKTLALLDGTPRTVCDLRNLRGGLRGGAWNADGVILFSTGSFVGLYRVPAAGGTPVPVTTLDTARGENSHRWPAFLADGRHFVYFARTAKADTTGLYLGALDAAGGQFITAAESGPSVAPGHLLFVRNGALLALPFDARRLRASGDTLTVLDQVALGGITRRGMFTVSATGVLAYWNGGNPPRTLTWFARNGERLSSLSEPRAYRNPMLSPDGRRVAVEVFDAATGASDLWLLDAATSAASRFTFERGHRRYPVWSPDGSRIIYQSDHQGAPAFYEKASSGAGIESLVLKPASAATYTPQDWTANGDALVYQINDPVRDTDIWMLPLGTKAPVAVVQGAFDQGNPRVSPDGRWIAYTSNESGRTDVYVQAFPGPGGIVQISTAGGTEPQWRGDGRELFFLAADRRIMAAAVEADGGRVSASAPVALFAAPIGTPDLFARSHFSVAGNGQRFLVNTIVSDATPAPISVLTNWLAEVRKN